MELWKVTAYLGISFWFGVIWKRANRYGAWTSALTMAGVAFLTGNILGWSFPNQIAMYLPVGIVLMIIVSRFTRPEPEEKLRQFYMLLDTPVGKEERLRQANVNIKLEGISVGKEPGAGKEDVIDGKAKEEVEDGLFIVDLLSIPRKFSWKRYRTDILGFGTAVLLVIGIILLAIFLAGFGG